MKGKICILGGGPAGLAAATQGAKLGYDVVLFEKNCIGDDIRCAEGYIDTLGLLGKPRAGTRFRVKSIVFQTDHAYELDVSANQGFWMIDRREWQVDFAQRAKELGVKIYEKTRIRPEDLDKLQGEYDYLIDATGVQPVTAKRWGFIKEYRDSCAVTVSRVLRGDFSSLYEKIKVGLEPHYHGYYWIFPKDRDLANVGIGCFNYDPYAPGKINLWRELERIMRKEGIKDYEVLRSFGGSLPVRMLDRVVYGNIILVGDAGGLCSPLHGGGIDLACISGKMAIDAIHRGRVEQYRQDLWEVVGSKIELEREIVRIWQSCSYSDLDAILKIATDRKFVPKLGKIHLPHLHLQDLKNIYHFIKLYLRTDNDQDKWFED